MWGMWRDKQMMPTFLVKNSKRLCPYDFTIPLMIQHIVCTYCLHPKTQHVYYLGQMDNKHPCRGCDCVCFKSM
jgi:hypothetical protein